MNLSPVWNGEIPEHRNQYERITEAFLDGHLYFDEVPSGTLAEMENPYDPAAREELGVACLWDHAYYNGRYYMYFGVVPVFLAFLPYRVITGTPLMAYRATRLFVALFIVGLFLLLYELAKKFFRKLSLGVYLFLAVALSAMSVWYAVSAPALYCTAITAGMATMVWGLYFWVKALWGCQRRGGFLLCATLGSLFGALTFGCRPPIGLANILVLAMMIYGIRTKPHRGKWLELSVAILPYVIVGVLLMVYNYVRFDNVFEFGQSYQLTQVDIRNRLTVFNAPTLAEKGQILLKQLYNYCMYLLEPPVNGNLLGNGIFIMFPILFYIPLGLCSKQSRVLIRQNRIRLLVWALVLAPFAVLVVDVLGSPDVMCRYRMDTYWLFGLVCYFAIGLYYRTGKNRPIFSSLICYCAVFTVASCVLLFLYPADGNFTDWYQPQITQWIG